MLSKRVYNCYTLLGPLQKFCSVYHCIGITIVRDSALILSFKILYTLLNYTAASFIIVCASQKVKTCQDNC